MAKRSSRGFPPTAVTPWQACMGIYIHLQPQEIKIHRAQDNRKNYDYQHSLIIEQLQKYVQQYYDVLIFYHNKHTISNYFLVMTITMLINNWYKSCIFKELNNWGMLPDFIFSSMAQSSALWAGSVKGGCSGLKTYMSDFPSNLTVSSRTWKSVIPFACRNFAASLVPLPEQKK